MPYRREGEGFAGGRGKRAGRPPASPKPERFARRVEENDEELFPEERELPPPPSAEGRRRYEAVPPEISRRGEPEEYESGPLEEELEDRSYEPERPAGAPRAPRGRRKRASLARGPEGEERFSDYAGWGEAYYEEEAPEPSPRRGNDWGEEEMGRGRGLSSRYDEDQVTGRRGTGSFGGEEGTVWEEVDELEDLEPGQGRRAAAFEEEDSLSEPGLERYPRERRGPERRAPTPRRRAEAPPRSRGGTRAGRGAGGGRDSARSR